MFHRLDLVAIFLLAITVPGNSMAMDPIVFVARVAGSITDPLALVFYVLIGALVPRFYWMLGAAAAGAICVGVAVLLINQDWWRRIGLEPSEMFAQSIIPRIVGALIVCSVVFGVAHLTRKIQRKN